MSPVLQDGAPRDYAGIWDDKSKSGSQWFCETVVVPVKYANRVDDQVSFTRILRYCKYCEKETAHEAHIGPDGSSETCIRCRELALMEELDPE